METVEDFTGVLTTQETECWSGPTRADAEQVSGMVGRTPTGTNRNGTIGDPSLRPAGTSEPHQIAAIPIVGVESDTIGTLHRGRVLRIPVPASEVNVVAIHRRTPLDWHAGARQSTQAGFEHVEAFILVDEVAYRAAGVVAVIGEDARLEI